MQSESNQFYFSFISYQTEKAMTSTFIIALFAVLSQYDFVSAQESQVPQSLTAAELWNPTTWFYPFAIATAESYKDYYIKAQKATNDLYKQVYSTNAFPWITGNWDFLNPNKQKPEQKPEENKPEENKPEENKPEENKPEENKPEENKPEENKPEENKPEENKPEENKPEENKPEENKPEEEKPQGGDVNAEVQSDKGGAQAQGNVEEGTADAQVDDGKAEE